MELVEVAIEEVEAGFLFIDPITSAFSDRVDINKTDSVRHALFPIQDITTKHNLSTVYTRHHKKGKSGSIKEQGTGSNAFQEVARAGVAFYEDQGDETGNTKLFVHFKKNLHARVKPLKYTIVDGLANGHKVGTIKWLGESDLTDKQIYEGVSSQKVGEVRTDINTLLRDGKEWATKDIAYELVLDDREETGKAYDSMVHTLQRMVRAGELVQTSKGKFKANKMMPAHT